MRLPLPLTSLLALSTLLGPSFAAKSTATSFCKCICFNNSTIIALNPPGSSTQSSSLHQFDIRSLNRDATLDADLAYRYTNVRRDGRREHELDFTEKDTRQPASTKKEDDGTKSPSTRPSRPHHKLTCADCTRAFCLDYNLPICKNAREEDVFTTCFQRDSLKDETVVVIFIFATAGLLAWALVKPWIDRLRERSSSSTFTPLTQHTHDRTGGGSQTTLPRVNPNTNKHNTQSAAPYSRIPPDAGAGSQVHADQDAVDIVSSGLASGSGSGVR